MSGTSDDAAHGDLRRSLGLLDATMLGVGAVLGAGTYAIIGEATGIAGSYIWLSLLIAAATALLSAGVYAECVSRYPDAGGGYEFLAQAFGRRFANYAALLLVATTVVASATIAIAFSEYLNRLVSIPVRVVAPAIIGLMGVVNLVGIREASWYNIGATVVTLAGLLMVLIAGFPTLGDHSLTEHADAGWSGVLGGAAMAFFAYVGFEDVVTSVEETQRPRRTMPRALIMSGAIVLVVNVAVGIAAVSVLRWDELAGSEGPLSAVLADRWGAVWGVVLTGIALIAMSKTVLSNILGGSRITFDVGRDTALPAWVSWVWQRTQTPVVAVALATLAAAAISLIGDLGTVATMSNLAVLALFLLVNAALLRIRHRTASDPDAEAPPFRLPLNVGRYSVLNLLAIGFVLVLAVFNVLNLLR